MSKKEELYEIADKIGEQVFERVCAGLLPPEEWMPVVIKGSDVPVPYMVLSTKVGGMVMIARWINTNAIQSITEEDIADMIVGSDGRTTN